MANNSLINRTINNTFIIIFARIVVGLMFIVVGIGKINNAAEFAEEIRNYLILPEFLLNIAAISISWIELFVGIFILFGIKIKSSSLLVAFMLIVFTTGVIIAMMKGLNINCGCYAQIASQKVGFPKVFENIGLFILTLILLFSNNNRLTIT